ncbi:MAG: glycosyl hydrolase family 28-related protein, partial [Verrucomicrobiota bacterium]
CLIFTVRVQAQTYTTLSSSATGNWSEAGTWNGAQPAAGGGTDVTLAFTAPASANKDFTNDFAGVFMLNQMTNQLTSLKNLGTRPKSGLTPPASLLFTNTSAGVLPAIYSGDRGTFFYLPVVLATNLIIDSISGGGGVIFTAPASIISESARSGITKTGTGSLAFRCANTYTGPTVISGGTLALAYSAGTYLGSISNSSSISIAAGAIFDVSAIPTAYALSTNNTITASGTATAATIKGAPGSTVNLGAQAITLNYDGFNPALTISQGSLVLSNNALTVNSASPLAAGDYTIIANTGSGTITTNGAAFAVIGTAVPTNLVATLNFITNSPSQVILHLAKPSAGSIPAAALNDPRYGLGYLVVTYYPGVTNDGTGDCRAGIQAALDHAFLANYNFQSTGTNRALAVFFPPGTYQISDILECYQWEPTNQTQLVNGFHMVVGSTEGTNRPVIKLATGAINYQDSLHPRQMISFRRFQGGYSAAPNVPSPSVPVPDPMSTPAGYTDAAGTLFWGELRNLDFDCNHNPGAVGATLEGCQSCAIANVRVDATGAYAGFCALPGAGSCSANIEVEGGQFGIIHGHYPELGINISGSSGPVIAGLKLQNQTAQAMKVYDNVSPISVVGFQITGSKSIVTMPGTWNLLAGSLTLVDGQIGISGGTNMVAIDNSFNIYGNNGRNLYLRNVYVTGTTNLVLSKSTMTTGSGTWSWIKEYSYQNTYNNPSVPPNTGYTNGDIYLESYSLINGVITNYLNPFPVLPNIVTNSGPPPPDLVSRHLWASFPSYNGATNDPPTVLVSTNAGWNNTNDDTVTLQTAINQATNTPYNGRVFLPGGNYFITNTLTLCPNTVLMGAGWENSVINVNPKWQPTTGEVPMLQTVDDANATTTLAWLSVVTRRAYSAIETNYSRFNAVNWRAGGNSLNLDAEMVEPYNNPAYANTQPRSHIKITGNGGGHWYTLGLDSYGTWATNRLFRKLTISGTSQPLWFYGFNIEHGSGDEEVDIFNSSNVRMVGWKREGNNALLVISNSSNIGLYTAGCLRYQQLTSAFQVLGASTNILMANIGVQDVSAGFVIKPTDTMLNEAITGQPTNVISWPNMVSLYKRGELNDAAVFPYQEVYATLAVQANPTNAGSISGGGSYLVGTTNGLTATASNNWVFVGWSDSVTNNPRWVVLPTNGVNYTANFSSLTVPTLAIPPSYTNPFGFFISGDFNQTVVVEACTNLTTPVWVPLQTNTLHGSPVYFNDVATPQPPVHYYRLRNL